MELIIIERVIVFLKRYHIQAKQHWDAFTYNNKQYCLTHLSAHEVIFKGHKKDYKFVVTYGLHCFAKDNQKHSINYKYSDSFESRQVDLERYHLSKSLKSFIEKLDSQKLLFETAKEKYFTIEHTNDLSGINERCKVCVCIFKENRLLRLHVTTAFFDRVQKEVTQKGVSIFKVIIDTERKRRGSPIPKEASRK